MFLTIKVGSHYQLRNKEIITIVRQEGDDFIGNNTKIYNAHGEYDSWGSVDHVFNIDREVVVNENNISVVELPSYPEGCNPFLYDHSNMGCQISGSWMAMHSRHAGFKRDTAPIERYPDPISMELVNTRTGRRFRLDLENANKTNAEIGE